MTLNRLKHLGTCFGSALLLTWAATALDAQRSGVHQTLSSLKWARQVASQAEGMVFKAKESGEKDPLEWAVNYLSQGVEPRLVRISRAHVQDSNAQNIETYFLDRSAGTFDYTHVFTPEDGAGIHVQLNVGYIGFLGAKSVLMGDLLALVFFGFCFALVFLRTGRYFGFDDARRIRVLVSQWVTSAKTQLTRHGAHVREMVRQSQRLAVSSGKSRDLVGDLRIKIHEGLTELHESREFYNEGENIAARAETLALNMAIEANRLGGDARRIADMATELHRRIQALHSVNRKGQSLIHRLERKIEPWSTDADLAYHAFEEIKDATDLLGQHIRSTTESLLGQAKLIQGLNLELGAADAPTAKSAASVAPPQSPPTPLQASAPVQAPAQVQAQITPPSSEDTHRLPDPLPPIEERAHKPLFRRIKSKKSA